MTNRKILFFDTETSGFGPKSWICQLGYIFSTENQIISETNQLIQSDGRYIHPKAQEIHGLSTDMCDLGLEESTVIETFIRYLNRADLIVGHNLRFDSDQLVKLMRRVGFNFEADRYESDETAKLCTMLSTIEHCNLPGRYGKPKWPKLTELHQIIFGCDFSNAHDALADVRATRDCYYELLRQGVIS